MEHARASVFGVESGAARGPPDRGGMGSAQRPVAGIKDQAISGVARANQGLATES